MASTFSNNGLELIATGEQEATWGETTNENLEMIDEAIDGVFDITSSSTTITLQITSGASSNGRHKVLRFMGTPVGAVTATVEPNTAQKWYIVWNQTGQNLIIAQGSGSTSTIATGRTAIVYADGAGVTASVTNVTNLFGMSEPVITGGTVTGATISGSTINNDVTGNLLGTPTAPTPVITNSSERIATTAYVRGIVPAGIVAMWSGTIANIPAGWLLCNGSSSTPNLLNRFVICAGGDFAVGVSGGSRNAVVVAHTHTFSATTGNQSANHSHTGTTDAAGAHTHSYIYRDGNLGGNYTNGGPYGVERQRATDSAGNHTHTFTTGANQQSHNHNVSGSTASSGVSGTDANMPPYYALAFIMKT